MFTGAHLGHRLGTGQVLEVRLRCILSVVHHRLIRILKSNSQDFSWLIIWGFKVSCVAQADVIWNIFRSQNHFRAHFHQRETRQRHWLPESCGSPLAAQVSSSASPSSSPRGKSAERTDWALPDVTASDTATVWKVRAETSEGLTKYGESKRRCHLCRGHCTQACRHRDVADSDESRVVGVWLSLSWRGSWGREEEVVTRQTECGESGI